MGLKIIEKVSRYHREHAEKSYSSGLMRRWIKEAGGRLKTEKFGGFVPMLCSDKIARLTKTLEPVIERVPLLDLMGSAVYVMTATRE